MIMAQQKGSAVGFVVLTWNSAEYAEKCIRSILRIESRPVALFVVDNGSVDGTVEIVEALAAQDERMRLFKESENRGTTVSRNIALRNLGEEVGYVCILDSDTIVNEDAVEALIALLESDPTIGLAGPTMRTSAGAKQLSGRNLPSLGIKLRKACPVSAIAEKGARMERPSAEIVNGVQDVGYLLSACWMMRRSVLDEVGMLDERIFYAPEDVDYCVRVHRAGFRVVWCHNAEIIHEYQRLSKRKLVSKMNWEHAKGLVYYFRKYGYLFNADRVFDEYKGYLI